MNSRDARQKMIAEMLNDMGFSEAHEDGLRGVPGWAYDLAERLLESGWRKR